MMRRRKAIKDLAMQRARILLTEAFNAVRRGEYPLARRYISVGLRLLRKAGVRKPMPYRRLICKRCMLPLIPGLTCRIRIRRNRKYIIVTKTCLECGWVRRIPCPRKSENRER